MSVIGRFLNSRVEPHFLGVFRIALGFFLLVYYVSLAPNWMNYYGPQSLGPEEIRPWSQFSLRMPSVFSYPLPDFFYWIFYGFCILSCLLLLVGWGRRGPLVWLWFANITISFRNFMAMNSEEQVLAILLFWCLFLPLEKTFCLRRKQGRWGVYHSTVPVRAWPLWLLQIQFASIYFISWPFRFTTGPTWADGTVIYYAVKSLAYSRFPGLELFHWFDGFFSRAAAYFTLAVELAFPLLVWFKRCRLPLISTLALLHLAIASVLHGVTMFNLAMVLGLILFLPKSARPLSTM